MILNIQIEFFKTTINKSKIKIELNQKELVFFVDVI